MISSSSNPQIKNIILLQKKAKARQKQGLFVVEGIKMVEESLQHGYEKVYVMERFYEELMETRPDFFVGVIYEIVSDHVFKEMTETVTPQGILSVVNMPHYTMEQFLTKDNGSFIILEDLRDPGNLGTIVRTAEGAGINGIIMSKETVDIFNPKVIRSTMGSIFRVPFVYVEDLIETVDMIKQQGVTIYAAHLNGKTYYDDKTYLGSCGILIGNEAAGLSDYITEKADVLIKIPMAGKVESLNAAVAASILMYEVARQRAQ